MNNNEKLNIWLLVLVAVVGVLLFQKDSLFVPFSQHSDSLDIVGMRTGYERALQQGTAHWWTGRWINETFNYYRPVSSYGHFAQLWTLDRFGMLPLTIGLMALYSAISSLAGLLAWQLTRRGIAAYATSLLVASYWIDGRFDWLAYFPYLDNLLMLFCQLLALVLFVRATRTNNSPMLAGAWVFFLLSGLSKEQGWVTPLLMLLLVVYVRPTRWKFYATSAVGMGVMGAGILTYSRILLGSPHNKLTAQLPSFWDTIATLPWVASLVAIAIITVIIYKYRPLAAYCLTAAAFCTVPSIAVNVDVMSFRAVFWLPWIAMLGGLCSDLLLTVLVQKSSCRQMPTTGQSLASE